MAVIHHPSFDHTHEDATTALDTIAVIASLAVAVVLIGVLGSI